MIAAQLVACHNASMECYRRAMLPDNSFDQRHGNLNSANKLSRTYSTLVEALNRHRGKGQQKMTVEHVHVYEGGQAIVGNVESRGEGSHRNQRNNPMHLDMHRALRCRARTRRGSLCQSPAMKNGRCRMHGGKSPGAPKGNKNALKHGRYTAEAIARRREVAELIRAARELIGRGSWVLAVACSSPSPVLSPLKGLTVQTSALTGAETDVATALRTAANSGFL